MIPQQGEGSYYYFLLTDFGPEVHSGVIEILHHFINSSIVDDRPSFSFPLSRGVQNNSEIGETRVRRATPSIMLTFQSGLWSNRSQNLFKIRADTDTYICKIAHT